MKTPKTRAIKSQKQKIKGSRTDQRREEEFGKNRRRSGFVSGDIGSKKQISVGRTSRLRPGRMPRPTAVRLAVSQSSASQVLNQHQHLWSP